jgi:hypothetical protein
MAAVCVYCSSSSTIDASYVELAEQVGARLAAAGHSLVSGGGRVSMMGAVARAARAGGAVTYGVIPAALATTEIADPDGELVVVDTMRERKRLMEERADVFVALPGGLGCSRCGRPAPSGCTTSQSSCSIRRACTRRSGPFWPIWPSVASCGRPRSEPCTG